MSRDPESGDVNDSSIGAWIQMSADCIRNNYAMVVPGGMLILASGHTEVMSFVPCGIAEAIEFIQSAKVNTTIDELINDCI